jgi:hypothetical protein
MDEMKLLAEMREDVRPRTAYPAAFRALMTEIKAEPPAPARRFPRRPILISGVLAGAVAVGAVAVAVTTGDEQHTSPKRVPVTSSSSLTTVTSPMTLAANAIALAQHARVPGPTAWIYEKKESTTSKGPQFNGAVQQRGSHQINEAWTRVDRLYIATVKNGRTQVTSTHGGVGDPLGWPKITYAYLNSLPSDPDALVRMLRRSAGPGYPDGKEGAVFTFVMALMENYTTLPPKLNATLYGVLARLKVVHLERTKDIAGRQVLSLFRIAAGYKESIFVDPTTYAFAGRRVVKGDDRTLRGLDGTGTRREGELLVDEAILVSKIVKAPGARS